MSAQLEKVGEILSNWKTNSSRLSGQLSISSENIMVWFKEVVIEDFSDSTGLLLTTLDGTRFSFPLRDAEFNWRGLKESGFIESSFSGVLSISLRDRAEIILAEKMPFSTPIM